MSSSTIVVRIAGVHDTTLEFWVAEVPQGPKDGFSRYIGYDHPALALQMIAGAANHSNALTQVLGWSEFGDATWLAAHTHEYVTSMTLIAVARAAWHSDEWISLTVQRQGSIERSEALTLALAPRALYRVTVADPAWLAHLRPGQEFGSTAYSPFPPVLREPVHHMTTPGAWEPVLAAMRAPIDEQRIHLYRNAAGPGIWCYDREEARVTPSNRVRELFLRHGSATFVYFDATAPRFNRTKFPFAERKSLPAPVVKMQMSGAAAGPRGFELRYDGPYRNEDGVHRVRFDHIVPGNKIAWLDVEGEPRVRIGDLAGVAPDSPSVDVDDYLRSIAERTRLDLGG